MHRALIRNDLPRRDVDVKRHRLVASVRSYLDVMPPRREGQRLGRRDKLADGADVHPIHTDLRGRRRDLEAETAVLPLGRRLTLLGDTRS